MSNLSIIIDDLRKLADDLSRLDIGCDSAGKPSAKAPPAKQEKPAPEQEAAKEPTTDDLRDAFAKVIAAGKKAEAMALVEPFGVSNVREIPTEAIPDLLRQLEEL